MTARVGTALLGMASLGLALLAASASAAAGGAPTADRRAPQRRSIQGSATPSQSMQIDIRGAVARVTVSRRWSCSPTGSQTLARGGPGSRTGSSPGEITDAVLDVALPARAQLTEVSIGETGRQQSPRALPLSRARDGYLEALGAMGIPAAEVAYDDEARLRIRTACMPSTTNKNMALSYSFTVLLEVSGDQARLAFPAAAELSPPATRVEVQVIEPLGFREVTIAGAPHVLHPDAPSGLVETVSTRSAWMVALGPSRLQSQPARRLAQDHLLSPSRLMTLTSTAARPGKTSMLGYAIGVSAAAPGQPLPERVLFLVDRSRSVGLGGLEAERDVARRVLEAMPPATRFDALFFDRVQSHLFPVVRTATREAIGALEDEMVPARLANGTDLAGALRAAGELLHGDDREFSPRCLLVLLTDGAVGSPAAGSQLATQLGPSAGVELMIASLSVRPNDDPEVSPSERQVLRTLAASAALGGVERTLRTADIADSVPAFLEDLRRGGDVYSISFPGAAAEGVVEVLGIGAGASGVLQVSRGAATTSGSPSQVVAYRGLPRPLPLRSVAVPAAWLEPMLTRSPAEARLLLGRGIAALVEPVVRVVGTKSDDGSVNPAGFMERSVVRDALSLAFTPRARACYLGRSARTPNERDLTGRVRLALDLVRGEVALVRLEASTLGQPGIENCLRESAYAIEVPRAYRNDDPVTAVLNLVFRPRTPERRPSELEDPSVSREIDLLIEGALKQPDPDANATATASSPDAGGPGPGGSGGPDAR